MRAVFAVVLSLLAVARTSLALSATGTRVLALVGSDNGDGQSTFLDSLQAKGFSLTIKKSSAETPLYKYGEALYDHLLFLAPEESGFGGLSAHAVIDFVNNGGNLLLAGAPTVNGVVRDVAAQLGIEFEDESPVVLDHIAYAEPEKTSETDADAKPDHSLVGAELTGHLVVPDVQVAPILYRGTALSLILPVRPHALLTASPTGFTASDDSTAVTSGSSRGFGRKAVLAAGLQARNNARVAVTGSVDIFSNKLVNSPAQIHSQTLHSKSGNLYFLNKLVAWTFQEVGIIRVKSVSHHKKGSTEQPESYRINDEVVYTIRLEQWAGSQWVPYVADDVQLEITMLNPYLRMTLNVSSTDKESLVGEFQLPDVYGVFTFRIDHDVPGKTAVRHAFQIPILPLRHNEYERFIPAAYPYYVGALSMMVGFWVFTWVWLYHSDPVGKSSSASTKVKTS